MDSGQIVPRVLLRGPKHDDPVKAKAVMEMQKIDVAVILLGGTGKRGLAGRCGARGAITALDRVAVV